MSFFIYHRGGICESDPPSPVFSLLLDELEENPEDEEHVSVSVIHESEWGLNFSRGGYVAFENVEGDGKPRHMSGVSREKLIVLMENLAGGNIAALETEPWQTGY